MTRSGKTTRYVRIAFAALLIFSAAQVSWWILDQWLFINQVQANVRFLYQQQVRAAHSYLEAGVAPATVAELFPEIRIRDGSVELDPGIEERLRQERHSRLNRYFWEGGFFFVVLLASIGVIGRTLRHDAALRRRQQNFLAAVSHELKSPLAAARIAAETLKLRDPPLEQRRHHVDRILRSIGRLERMITNLLETVRLEEGELALRPRSVDLAQAIAPALSEFEERAEDRGVSLQVRVAPGIMVLADEEAVWLVLRNLLANALEAVREADGACVEVIARSERAAAVLEVRDNGGGFRPQEASMLFEKFYRPGDEMRRGGHGAGLGLHIVRELMARSGGSVHAHSEGPGCGAVFRTRWPLADSP